MGLEVGERRDLEESSAACSAPAGPLASRETLCPGRGTP